MLTPKYKISELSIGDSILIYIHRQEGGATMGPSVEGIEEYARWVAFGGWVYNETNGQGYYLDTKLPIGIPLHDNCIFDVRKGESIGIIEEVMRKEAVKIGRWAIINYKMQFHKLPFEVGVHIKMAPEAEYKKINKTLGIRNNHAVLSSKNLILINNPLMENREVVTVLCKDTNKMAQTGLESLWGCVEE